MEEAKVKYKNLYHLFSAYLHQDWTINGESLEDIFARSEGLQRISPKIKEEALLILNEKNEESYLDRLFFRKWHAGYEPDVDSGEDWSQVLQKIIQISDTYAHNMTPKPE